MNSLSLLQAEIWIVTNSTFKQKPVAVVTGAAGGIGSAIAESLFQKDYRVVLADINQVGLEQVILNLGKKNYKNKLPEERIPWQMI